MQNRIQSSEKQVTAMSWASLFVTSLLIVGCGTDEDTFVVTEDTVVDHPALVSTAHAATPPPMVAEVVDVPEVDVANVDEVSEAPDAWMGVVPAEDPHAAYVAAEAAYYRAERNEAIPLLRSSIAARPEFVPAHYLLGLCSRATGELAEAEDAFRETIRLDEGHLRAYVNLGRVLIDDNRPADARTVLTDALDLGYESDGLYNVLGLAHLADEQAEEADEAFTKAIDMNPENLFALNNLGLLRIREGRFEEAVAPLTQASQMPDAPAYVFNNLGLALEQTGQLAESVDALTTATDAGHAGATVSLKRVSEVFDDQLAKLERDAATSETEPDMAATATSEPAGVERPVAQ